MKIPAPYLPDWQFKLSHKNRVRFAKYYWNPWWRVHNFCRDWLTVDGIIKYGERLAMDYLVWAETWRARKVKGCK